MADQLLVQMFLKSFFLSICIGSSSYRINYVSFIIDEVNVKP